MRYEQGVVTKVISKINIMRGRNQVLKLVQNTTDMDFSICKFKFLFPLLLVLGRLAAVLLVLPIDNF